MGGTQKYNTTLTWFEGVLYDAKHKKDEGAVPLQPVESFYQQYEFFEIEAEVELHKRNDVIFIDINYKNWGDDDVDRLYFETSKEQEAVNIFELIKALEYYKELIVLYSLYESDGLFRIDRF